MEMDMEEGHGDHGHGNAGSEGGSGHDKIAGASSSGHVHPEPSDANMLAFWERFQQALFNDGFETVAASFADDAIIFEGGVPEADLASYLEHHLKPEMPMLATIKPNVLRQDHRRNRATGWITTVLSWEMERDGGMVTVSSTETLILQFVHDDWKIVHVHWSNRRRDRAD